MKLLLTFCFLILIGNISFGQEIKNKTDLRVKIDSIIKNQLNYTIDSTTNIKPVLERSSTTNKGLHPSFNNSNPLPRIILNGRPVKIDSLVHHHLEDVAQIKVFPKDDPVMAIYGSSARNGVIVIKLKK